MKTINYIITDPEGIHARPAGMLVKISQNFTSLIKIEAMGKVIDCKKILGVMSLGAKKGTDIIITAEGDDEDIAIEEIEEFLKKNM